MDLHKRLEVKSAWNNGVLELHICYWHNYCHAMVSIIDYSSWQVPRYGCYASRHIRGLWNNWWETWRNFWGRAIKSELSNLSYLLVNVLAVSTLLFFIFVAQEGVKYVICLIKVLLCRRLHTSRFVYRFLLATLAN